MIIPAKEVFQLMNEYGSLRKPFLFGVDFDIKSGFFFKPEEAEKSGVYFNINGKTNSSHSKQGNNPVRLVKKPVSQPIYNNAFEIVYNNLVKGNSYLTNLTFPTDIDLTISLNEIFHRSKARYRLLFDDQFVVFSPEIFIQVKNGEIRSFPMKGTIDASIPNAAEIILNDYKEIAEHNTIVDLIRNDIGMVASEVKVKRFRYIESIITHDKTLLQVSSEITGILNKTYVTNMGDMLAQLLPAGSISGAPKKRTVQIIKEA